MSNYRRPKVTGATVFFTVNLAVRGGNLLVREIDVLREAVRTTREERPFEINAWVVMPDHLHAVWTLPKGDADYSRRWGAIKARFTRAVRDEGRVGFQPTDFGRVHGKVGYNPTLRTKSKSVKGDAGIWQRRFWEHHIRNQADYDAHVWYCWKNPVKHGFVEYPTDWPYSSVHRREKLRCFDEVKPAQSPNRTQALQ